MVSQRDCSRSDDEPLRQLLEQRLRRDQIARGEAFGEPGVDQREEVARGVALALALPERARLVAARSSNVFASCFRAISTGVGNVQLQA